MTTAARAQRRRARTTIAVVAYPRISNLDEFQPLKNVPGVRLRWVRTPAELAGADWIILPGSKHTSGDLAWLRAQGLDRAIAAHAAAGRRGAGRLRRPADAGRGADRPARHRRQRARAWACCRWSPLFEPDKTGAAHARQRFGPLAGPWAALSGVAVQGYEIHHGQTAQHPAMAAAGDVRASR